MLTGALRPLPPGLNQVLVFQLGWKADDAHRGIKTGQPSRQRGLRGCPLGVGKQMMLTGALRRVQHMRSPFHETPSVGKQMMLTGALSVGANHHSPLRVSVPLRRATGWGWML